MLDVHFPAGILLFDFTDDLVGEGVTAFEGDEGVAEEIEFPSSVISLDDSE